MIAIIFDLDDTIYLLSEVFIKTVKQIFPEFPKDSVEDLYMNFRKYSDELFDKSQKGLISMGEMRIERITSAMSEYNFSLTIEQAQMFQKKYMENQYNIELAETMKSIFELCHSKDIALGIITNGESKHQANKIDSLKLFDFINKENMIISGNIGIDKPNKEIFKQMQRSFPNISTFYYVGDNFTIDIIGAYKAKWNPIWFNANEKEVHDTSVEYVEVNSHKELYNLIKYQL